MGAFQWRLRNLACGLCGDLNDEKTVDVVSAQQCVMSSPRLAAYSYMVADSQCAGIPAQDKAVYQEEVRNCVRKAVVASMVSKVFMERQVSMCPSISQSAEIVPMQMPFFCLPKTQEGRSLQQLAQTGEKITEATRFPIAFTSTVHAPRRC